MDTPHQRRLGIKDSPELAFENWLSAAEFGPGQERQKEFARQYCFRCKEEVFQWLKSHSIGFFFVVQWAERGLFRPGNAVPRFHMLWGSGNGMTDRLAHKLKNHKNKDNLKIYFNHKVEKLIYDAGAVRGCTGTTTEDGHEFRAEAEALVVAAGGVNGDLNRVRENWDRADFGEPPEVILHGSHQYADGLLHDQVAALPPGGSVINLKNMWNYPSGLHRPNPRRKNDGITMVPPKSALWVNYEGRRFGPLPLVATYDTRYVLEQVCKQERKYSWQIMNKKILLKEVALQGSEYNPAFSKPSLLLLLKTIVFGMQDSYDYLVNQCEDVVTSDSLEGLVQKMNALQGDDAVQLDILRRDIQEYDDAIDRGPKFFADDQLRRISSALKYRGDRVRTCKFQKILDPKAAPYIAVREFVLARKSMGGIETDLNSRVLSRAGQVIPGLYAVGEAAGFGGGGYHGKGALEGTFLGGCIFSARLAANAIGGGT